VSKIITVIKTLLKGLIARCTPQSALPIPYLRWSAIAVRPNTSTWAMGAGDKGKAAPMSGSVGLQRVLTHRLDRLIVTCSPAAKGCLSVMLYKYRDGVWLGGWAPVLSIGAEITHGKLDLSDAVMDEGVEIQALLAYSPHAGNTDPIDVRATLFFV